jgi:hypothetical protein
MMGENAVNDGRAKMNDLIAASTAPPALALPCTSSSLTLTPAG